MSTRISVDVQLGRLLRAAQSYQASIRRGFVEGLSRVKAATNAQATTASGQVNSATQAVGGATATPVGASVAVEPLRSALLARPVRRVQPSPTANRRASRTEYVFLPTFAAARWFLTNRALGPLTETVSTESGGGGFSIVADGAPGGLDAIRVEPDTTRWLSIESPSLPVAQEGGGVTLELWVNFGSSGGPFSNGFVRTALESVAYQPSGVDLTAASGIRFRVVGDNDEENGGRITVVVQLKLPGFPIDFIAIGVDGQFIGGAFNVGVLDGISIGGQGWHHYCLEASRAGGLTVYVDGAVVATDTGNTYPEGFWEGLDTYIPVLGRNGSGDDWPNFDVHFMRFSPVLRYNGQPFTPPVYRP